MLVFGIYRGSGWRVPTKGPHKAPLTLKFPRYVRHVQLDGDHKNG